MSINKTKSENSITFIKSFESKNTNLDVVNKSEDKIHQGDILSFLIKNNKKNNERTYSLKTSNSFNSNPFPLDYNFKEIKRFDELNNSMSDISDFDLENDKKDNVSEFNSSEEDNSEFEEIKIKTKKDKYKRKSDSDFYFDLEKEYENILKKLKIKK